MNAVYLTNIR
jgi:hypothetical protein